MKTIIKKRSDLPKCVRSFKQLKGICVGACIDKDDVIAKRGKAHAHCHKKDKYKGWICLRYKYHLKERLTLLHEMAHLISPAKPYHGKKWKAALVKIGGTFKSYTYTHSGIPHKYMDYTYRNNLL